MTTPIPEIESVLLQRAHWREALIEDVFCSVCSHQASEESLRSLSQWMHALNIFSDKGLLEMWQKIPEHLKKAETINEQWTLFNNLSQQIKEGSNADN